MTLRRLFVAGVVVLVLAIPTILLSQTGGQVCEDPTCEVRFAQPFVAFTERDADAFNYQLFIDGQPSGLVPTEINGLVEFAHAGFAAVGTHTLVIHAQTSAGTGPITDAVTLNVVRRKVKIRR